MNYELEKKTSELAKNKIGKAGTQLGVSVGAERDAAKNVDPNSFSVCVHLLSDSALGLQS